MIDSFIRKFRSDRAVNRGAAPSPVVHQHSVRTLVGIAAATSAVMFLFEFGKSVLFPHISLWQSHLATIVFAALLATALAYFVGHALSAMNARLNELVGQVQQQVTALERNEKALRDSREKFSKAFASAPDCVAITELESGRVLEINDKFEKLTGYKASEVLGRTGSDLGLYEGICDQQGLRRQLLNEFRTKGEIHDFEYFLRRKSGEIATISVSSTPIEIAGQPCAFSVHRDITVQKMAEEALRASEEKFSKAFDATPDAVVIIHAESQKIIDVNQGFERITGYSRREALGHSTGDLNLWADPNDRDTLRRKMQRDGHVRESEHRIRCKNGEIVVVIGSGDVIELAGQKCYLTVNRDVTAHKAAEEATRKAEAKYRELVENANDIIFTVDRSGFCMSMNRRGLEIAGDNACRPEGINLQQLVVPEHAEVAWTQLQRVLNGEPVKPFEVDVMSSTGARIKFELSVRPVMENGVAVAAQGIARDVTERRELELQLRQAIKMEAVGRLAAGVAHDFNNLLTVILGNCEASLPELATSDPLREAMVDIQTSAERAASLTAQLLAFSRKQVVRARKLNLNDVIHEIQRMLKRIIGEDVKLDFCPAERLWTISADEGQIHQIVMNLAVNARDAMPGGGRLTLETQNVVLDEDFARLHPPLTAGEFVMMTIVDTGTGMDSATQARIFEPFFTTKTVGRGSGLGLATVYGIVKQNDGFIWVQSEPGVGTTFKIYFPRVPCERASDTSAPSASGGRRGHGETIMLVEDEKPLRDLVSKHLGAVGYEISSAADAGECLMTCEGWDRSPDLLVTDVVMPGMSGRSLADELRRRFPDLKVLYLSGYSDEAVLRHGILPTGTYFVQKPFTLSSLTDKIREILEADSRSLGAD